MARTNKRKRASKEAPASSKRNEGEEAEVDSEEEEEDQAADEDDPKSDKKSKSSNSDKKKAEDDRFWVMCNSCNKWRALPSHVNEKSLPELWYCEYNVYDPLRNACTAPEELYDPDVQLKSYVKLWLKRMKNSDKAESRFPPAAVTRGRKKKGDFEWIKCCNPSCGKWRAVLRSLDTNYTLRKLNFNKWNNSKSNISWYCSMNFWDETTASCAAPQEPLFDCPWNLGISNNSSGANTGADGTH